MKASCGVILLILGVRLGYENLGRGQLFVATKWEWMYILDPAIPCSDVFPVVIYAHQKTSARTFIAALFVKAKN